MAKRKNKLKKEIEETVEETVEETAKEEIEEKRTEEKAFISATKVQQPTKPKTTVDIISKLLKDSGLGNPVSIGKFSIVSKPIIGGYTITHNEESKDVVSIEKLAEYIVENI